MEDNMDYNQTISFLMNKQSLGIIPGLSRMKKLLEGMGNPQKNLKIIHIAGTNGKGTVANMIANALSAEGKKTGLFTSPWVVDYREQIQINSKWIPKEKLSEYVSEYQNAEATEFELITAIMYKYFYDEKVDYAIVECGMGGFADSTNAIDTPEIAVIASVSIDHTNFLGTSLAEIAFQKSGIIKPESKVVLYPNPACESVFEKKCNETNSLLIKVEDFGDFKR
ncbi:MAG: bifunctional folylpolyglutamate synthase/dihydrofolate synthase, partial [Clostridiales bacterium]|nr:bifunctional folylpolyglutamate synthase/dihydrofolate synthase [Clostridiales bacterium]